MRHVINQRTVQKETEKGPGRRAEIAKAVEGITTILVSRKESKTCG
jgi:hypothetical protein